MLQLVDAGHVSAALVIEVAESIHSINPLYITQKILTLFRRKAQLKGRKS